MFMALLDLFLLTKIKFILLILFLAVSLPAYFALGCISPGCTANAASSCVCGFSFNAFYVVFIWAYVAACVIVEVYKRIRKKKS